MDSIRTYIMSVIAAAVVVSVAVGFVGDKTTSGAMIKMLAGLLLATAFISPLANIEIIEFGSYWESVQADADREVELGQETADENIRTIIKDQTEAYILDKAFDLGVDLTVSVSLSPAQVPKPDYIELAGSISPYAKKQLTEIIEKDIGIPKGDQIWK